MAVVRYATIDDATGIARVHADSWRGAYRGIVPDDYLDAIDVDEWSERRRQDMEEMPEEWVSFVAEVNGRVVGWAVGGPNREADTDHTGELYVIYLLPEYQRRGIGLKLIVTTAAWLLDRGLRSMIVWVLAANWPARRFYEALGGAYLREQQINIGGTLLPEVAYGWSDLNCLTHGSY